MSDLSAAYDRLARSWTHEQLAARYRDAKRRGEQPADATGPSDSPADRHGERRSRMRQPQRGDSRDPRTAGNRNPRARDQLLRNAETNSAVALYRCHEALELDGQAHDYSADEWLPAVYDIAAPLLEGARLNCEPPSLVEQVQEAVRWLSRAIVDLDQEAPGAAAAMVDGLGRLCPRRLCAHCTEPVGRA